MSRRGQAEKRTVTVDPRYGNLAITKFINQIMQDGKKGLAQRIFYDAMDAIQERTGKDPLDVFEAALDNVTPVLEVRPRRVGGTTYQVPMEVRPERRQALAIRWIVSAARKRGERTMAGRIAGELLDASNGGGAAVRRREDVHRMAEANQAFAHYRW